MCHFPSEIVLRNGDSVFMPEYTDSHEDLMDQVGIKTCGAWDQFVRVEYNYEDPLDPESYRLNVDEQVCPEWFDPEMRRWQEERMRERIGRMVVTKPTRMLLGGCWLLGPGAEVDWAVGARIVYMRGACIRRVVGRSWIGTVAENSLIEMAGDHARVEVVTENGRIDLATEHVRIDFLAESASVRQLMGWSQVLSMVDRSTVERMGECARVMAMWIKTRVEAVGGYAEVEEMCGETEVGDLSGMARVRDMHGRSVVRRVRDQAMVLRRYEQASVENVELPSQRGWYGGSMSMRARQKADEKLFWARQNETQG